MLGAGCDDGRSSFGRSNAGSFRPTHHFRLRRGAPTVIGSPISGVASSMPFAAASAQAVERVVPRMEGEVEGAVVDVEQHLGVQVLEGADALLGRHVHGRPVGVGTVWTLLS